RRRADGEDAGRVADASPGGTAHAIALAVDPVILEGLGLQGPEGVEADVQGDAFQVEPAEDVGSEVQAGGGRRRRTLLARVHRLVALRIGERLDDVRRERRDTCGLALDAHAPAALAEMLEQLDRAVPPAGAEPAR